MRANGIVDSDGKINSDFELATHLAPSETGKAESCDSGIASDPRNGEAGIAWKLVPRESFFQKLGGWTWVRRQIVVTILCALTAWFGVQFIQPETKITVVWPAMGVAVAAVYLWGESMILGLLITDLGLTVLLGYPLWGPLITFPGECAVPILGRRAMLRFCKTDTPFYTAQHVLWFLCFQVCLIPCLVPPLGLLLRFLMNALPAEIVWSVATQYWWGYSMGILLAAPPLILMFSQSKLPCAWVPERHLELLLSGIFQIGVVSAIFFSTDFGNRTHPSAVMPIPLLLWMAYRFTPRETTILMCVTAMLSVIGTEMRCGPFSTYALSDELLMVQVTTGVEAAMLLLFAALIHEVRATSTRLEAEQKRYKTLFDESPTALFLVDQETGKPQEMNRQARELLGFTDEELARKPLADLIVEHGRDQKNRSGFADSREFIVQTKDGRKVDVNMRQATLSSDAQPMRMVVMNDISGKKQNEREWQKWHQELEGLVKERSRELQQVREEFQYETLQRTRAEDALHSIEDQLQVLSDHVPGLLIKLIIHGDGTFGIPLISRGCESLLGHRPAEIQAQPEILLGMIHPEDRERAWNIGQSGIRNLVEFHLEFRIISSQQQIRWLEMSLIPKPLPNGEIQLNGLAWEITDRKRAEENLQKSLVIMQHMVEEKTSELRTTNQRLINEIDEREKIEARAARLQSKLNQASKLSVMGEVAAGIAHELNQPLMAIANYANGSLRRIHPERSSLDFQAPFQEISSATMRAAEIIRRVRTFLQNREIERKPFHLNEVVKDALHLVRSEIENRETTIRLNLLDPSPKTVGDPVQFAQVVVNYLINAMDAMDDLLPLERIVEIRTFCVDENRELCLEVIDQGAGVDESTRSGIFQQFYTTKADGLGLGLAMSRSIVEAHGGKCGYKSATGSGTCFWFTVPVETLEIHFSHPPQAPLIETAHRRGESESAGARVDRGV